MITVLFRKLLECKLFRNGTLTVIIKVRLGKLTLEFRTFKLFPLCFVAEYQKYCLIANVDLKSTFIYWCIFSLFFSQTCRMEQNTSRGILLRKTEIDKSCQDPNVCWSSTVEIFRIQLFLQLFNISEILWRLSRY